MSHKSVLLQIAVNNESSEKTIRKQVYDAADLVTDGRYLISLFESPTSWDSRLPIEAFIISEILGPIENRNSEWEFFGNGAIRAYTYKGDKFDLTKTYQWNILRRVGDKPYSRRHEVSASFLKKNSIPVSDPVFTRDVANNVWHLKQSDLFPRILSRFACLLSWQDEEFIHLSKGTIKNVDHQSKLDLSEDLVGVPTKIEYLWNSGNKLF
jgi:hypothetical protein